MKNEKENNQNNKIINKKSSESNILKVFLILLAVLVLVYSFNIIVNGMAISEMSKKVADIKEKTRPAELNIIRIVDSDCTNCFNLNNIVNAINNNNLINIVSDKTIEYSSNEGNKWINKAGIERIPALLITGEINKKNIQNIWTNDWNVQVINGKEEWAYFTSTPPPYINPISGESVGLVSVIYLDDSSCTDCYDVKINKNILESRFAMTLVNEEEIDVSSSKGQELVSKYGITKFPTIFVSPEANAYPLFVSIWESVGITADDGWYVMTKPEIVGKIKDLSK